MRASEVLGRALAHPAGPRGGVKEAPPSSHLRQVERAAPGSQPCPRRVRGCRWSRSLGRDRGRNQDPGLGLSLDRSAPSTGSL